MQAPQITVQETDKWPNAFEVKKGDKLIGYYSKTRGGEGVHFNDGQVYMADTNGNWVATIASTSGFESHSSITMGGGNPDGGFGLDINVPFAERREYQRASLGDVFVNEHNAQKAAVGFLLAHAENSNLTIQEAAEAVKKAVTPSSELSCMDLEVVKSGKPFGQLFK